MQPVNVQSNVVQFAIVDTGWGAFGLVARGQALVRTYLPRSRAEIRRHIRHDFPAAVEETSTLRAFQRQAVDYFRGKPAAFDVRLDLSDVPPFRARVLEACRRIPFGRTASYADLARAAGNPAAVRAAGGAMAHNPLPLVVPCHRILSADGSIGGFSSSQGVEEKLRLLRHEGVQLFGKQERRLLRAV
jgi:methylated-DNA-[protein]-cysteine S-methyltransferase